MSASGVTNNVLASVVLEQSGVTVGREIRVFVACKRLDCSQYSLWKLEREGRLRMRRERVGASMFGPGRPRVWVNEEDIVALKKTGWRPALRKKKKLVEESLEVKRVLGELAALCLPLFAEHCGGGFENETHERFIFAEIVRVTRAHPGDVRLLFEEWVVGLAGGLRAKNRREGEAREREAWRERAQNERHMAYRTWKAKERKAEMKIAELNAETAAKVTAAKAGAAK